MKAKGGVDGYRLLSEPLFGMCAFYVVRKHTTVRHNKWSDGAIREGFVDGERSSKERDTLIALSDPPLAFVYELIKHC